MPPGPKITQFAQQEVLLDASKRHPVFFTDRLQRAPVGVAAGGRDFTPVAKGYIFNDGVRRSVEGTLKL